MSSLVLSGLGTMATLAATLDSAATACRFLPQSFGRLPLRSERALQRCGEAERGPGSSRGATNSVHARQMLLHQYISG